MPGGTDAIWRAAREFNINPLDLKSGAIDLCDIAEMNDYLDLEVDNKLRIKRWREAND